MKKKKVMFIASTGGHLDELLQLKSLFNKYDFSLVTEKTKNNIGLKDKYGKRLHYIISGTYKCIYPIIVPFRFIAKITFVLSVPLMVLFIVF